MSLKEIIEKPIPGDNPFGKDIRYDPEFESLQEMLGTQLISGNVDWKMVESKSISILQNKSKHLLVAAYLALSRIHTRKGEEIAEAFAFFHDFLQTYWENMFPEKERKRARHTAIEWWMEKTETALLALRYDELTKEQIALARKELEKIETLLDALSEDSFSLRPLIRTLNNMAGKQEQAGDVTETRKAGESESSPGKTSGEEDIGQDEKEQNPDAILSAGVHLLHTKAVAALQRDMNRPLAYRLNRISAWAPVFRLPENIKGKTALSAPEADIKDRIMKMMEEEAYPQLVLSCERFLYRFVFWIDLNRYCASALSHMGEEYRESVRVISMETAFFLSRMPKILEFHYGNGMPFADEETRKWAQETGVGKNVYLPFPSSGKDLFVSPTQGEDQQEEKEFLELLETDLKDGLDFFREKSRFSGSNRKLLRWRCLLAQTLIRLNRAEIALPHLTGILSILDTHSIETWDPPSALESLSLVYTGLRLQKGSRYDDLAAEVANRIALLHPGFGMRLFENNKPQTGHE